MIELLSVYDAAADRYMDLYCAPTIEFGIRGFREACGQEGHQFTKFPEDYSLWHVGQFDGATGVVSEHAPRKIAHAQSFMREVDKVQLEGRN